LLGARNIALQPKRGASLARFRASVRDRAPVMYYIYVEGLSAATGNLTRDTQTFEAASFAEPTGVQFPKKRLTPDFQGNFAAQSTIGLWRFYFNEQFIALL
jgi:hypothetical protein